MSVTGPLGAVRAVATPRGRFALREGGAADAPVVLLLHGWPQSSWCWQAMSARLSGRWRLIAPDLRGMGDSERSADPAAYDKDALARDVLALLDLLGIGEVRVVGHDWGGVVAQELALAAPERVAALCIANIFLIHNVATNQRIAASGMSRYQWYQYFMMTGLPERMIPGNEDAWLAEFLRRSDGRPLDARSMAEYLRCHRIDGTAAATAHYYRRLRHDVARWSRLAGHRFEMPCLLIHGERDPVITAAYFERAERGFASLQRVTLPAGHFVQEECPEAFAKALESFVGTPGAGAQGARPA